MAGGQARAGDQAQPLIYLADSAPGVGAQRGGDRRPGGRAQQEASIVLGLERDPREGLVGQQQALAQAGCKISAQGLGMVAQCVGQQRRGVKRRLGGGDGFQVRRERRPVGGGSDHPGLPREVPLLGPRRGLRVQDLPEDEARLIEVLPGGQTSRHGAGTGFRDVQEAGAALDEAGGGVEMGLAIGHHRLQGRGVGLAGGDGRQAKQQRHKQTENAHQFTCVVWVRARGNRFDK